MKDDVIAVDGPAASGKSTVARLLSEHLSIPYINTGNMYRAVTWFALEKGYDLSNPTAETLKPVISSLDIRFAKNPSGYFDISVNGTFPGSAIRSPEVASYVSGVAAIPEIRSWLLGRQRSMTSLGLIVMEGRDIGTNVFPGAKFKFFLTADPIVRARRRLNQAGENYDGATLKTVAEQIAERDRLDSSRAVSPLKPATDAVAVDSSNMSIEEVISFMLKIIKGGQGNGN